MSVKLMCSTDRHQLCGGHACSCDCHPGTIEERAAAGESAVRDWLRELDEVIGSTGRHAGHALEQIGRCVYCSPCGYRYQGTLPKANC